MIIIIRKLSKILPILFLLLPLFSCRQTSSSYGVFLGLTHKDLNSMKGYDTVVLEPSEFSKRDIQKLQASGSRVYGYLNLGAIENYRPYYHRFHSITLSPYEDWPDERWIDVSQPSWQKYILTELAPSYAKLGLDGFFIDNTDVYAHYPTEPVFRGLSRVLKELHTPSMTILINGGDLFVSRCLKDGNASLLFDGVNQESVFTSINFREDRYGPQDSRNRRYYQDYLARVREAGLDVYLLEYGKDWIGRSLQAEIASYCKKQGYQFYLAKDKELKKAP